MLIRWHDVKINGTAVRVGRNIHVGFAAKIEHTLPQFISYGAAFGNTGDCDVYVYGFLGLFLWFFRVLEFMEFVSMNRYRS